VRRLFIAGALDALLCLVLAGSAGACSCAPMEPSEAMRESDAAIVGRLVKVVPRGAMEADYRYEVQRVYRGARMIDRGDVVSVRSSREEAACALPRHTGRRYGLFLTHAEGRWRAGICEVISPRRLWTAAQRGSRIYRRGSGGGANCA